MNRTIGLIRRALSGGAPVLAALAFSAAAQAASTPRTTQFPYTFTNPTTPATTTVIPSEPKRVVVVGGGNQQLDVLAALGVKPIAYDTEAAPAATSTGVNGVDGNGLPLWVNGGELSGMQLITGAGGPNYEAIAALKPDLIITGASNLQQLGAIAPTIDDFEDPWPPGTPPAGQLLKEFFDAGSLQAFAPIFNDTTRAQQILTRFHALAGAASGFAKGITVDLPEFPSSGTVFYQITSDASLGGIFDSFGDTIEPIASVAPSSQFQVVSTELMPQLTAQKVIAWEDGTTQAFIEGLPLYSQIPAVKTGQFYVTAWQAQGVIGAVDSAIALQKQVFGITGLQAMLTGTGESRASRSGYAYVDVGSDGTGVCWDFGSMLSGTTGSPQKAVIETTKSKPTTLLTLGGHYSTTGCASFKSATVAKLLQHPGSYQLVTETTKTGHVKVHVKDSKGTKRVKRAVTTVYLQGKVAPQSPAWFGNGKDTVYNLPTT